MLPVTAIDPIAHLAPERYKGGKRAIVDDLAGSYYEGGYAEHR